MVRAVAMDATEGLGATLYAFCGLASLIAGRPFLTNIMPFGTPRDLFSGGLMLIENARVALADAGGFSGILIELLEETRAIEPGE